MRFRSWASISKFGGDEEEFLAGKGESLLIFDRSVIQDNNGIDTIFWEAIGQIPFKASSSFPVPTNRVRASVILTQADINKLRHLVLASKSDLVHISSFVVTASYVWTCFVKSGDAVGEEVEETVPEVFFFTVDAQGRLNCLINPPVPENYFENCVGGGIVDIEHKNVVGDDGFVIAAEAIVEQIKNIVNNKDEFLKDVEKAISEMGKFHEGVRAMGVSGSPKFELPNADFGWGKERKLEVVSMDGEKYSMSMCKSRDYEGLKIGLSLPKERMEAFAAIFVDGQSS